MKPVQKNVSPVVNRRIRARNNRLEKTRKKSSFPKYLLSLFIPALAIAGFFVFFNLSKQNWNGEDKVSFVFRNENGDVGVTVLDPSIPDMTTMYIPADTQVEVAASYGVLRIKNVWQLGLNEKKGGNLLAKTVAKNFLFPLYLWTDTDGSQISKGSFSGLVKFVFLPQKTNISFGDRASMAMFVMKLKNIEKTEIDLAKSQFIRKDTLSDGEKGYTLSGPVSERLTVFFSDNEFAEQGLRVAIVDGTFVYGAAQKVGELIEVMGGKVVSLEKNQQVDELVCSVSGNEETIVQKVSKIFGCTISSSKNNLDLEINLGKEFTKNF